MHLARVFAAAVLALAAGTTSAAAAPTHSKVTYERACTGAGRRCYARIATQDGVPRHFVAAPIGEIAAHSPDELQHAYHVDVTRGAGMTIAVVDAYGYPKLEADLKAYRAMYGLPPCTVASGCLRIVGSDGGAAPGAPSGGGMGNHDAAGWQLETALDVDMVSAGCPQCKILVVESAGPDDGLDEGNATAARLGASSISNSWGSPEDPSGGDVGFESVFDQPGVGIYVSSGDDGFPAGPQYPATSLHVIAVGGTRVKDNLGAHTATETAWAEAGSSCSTEFAAPAFQPSNAACTKRAASDISADADPATGVSLYCSAAGGWTSAGGTSASSPLVAAIMAASGHPDANAAFVYRHPEAFQDVSGGNNGACGTTMCNAGSGWDGPTGLGSPNQDKLAAIGAVPGPGVWIGEPLENTNVSGAFAVTTVIGDGATHVDLAVDGVRVVGLTAAPYEFVAPAITTPGTHTVTVSAYDEDGDVGSAQVHVYVAGQAAASAADAGVAQSGPDAGTVTSGNNDDGGCAAGGGAGGGSVLLMIGAVLAGRRGRRRALKSRLP
jgi:hypothetical protein